MNSSIVTEIKTTILKTNEYIKSNKIFYFVFFITIFLSFCVRFNGLGFSNFYADETKVFYLDKTVPATEFFLDQRKGPMQYVVLWITEKLFNGHNELFSRLPYAFFGFFSVVIFYNLVFKILESTHTKITAKKTYKVYFMYISFVAMLLFSFSGFNVAFSRTIQYQSILTFFGLLGFYFYLKKNYLLSGTAYAFAFLAHYDTIFFITPLLYFFVNSLSVTISTTKNILNEKKLIKKFIINSFLFIAPFLIITLTFYLPYFINGYFENNTLDYLNRRILGGMSSQKNYSAFTLYFYNNSYLIFSLLSLSLFLFFNFFGTSNIKDVDTTKYSYGLNKSTLFVNSMFFWFIINFIILQFFTTNPGTHIHSYFIPLYILSAYFVVYLISNIKNYYLSNLFKILFVVIFTINIVISMRIFVPRLSNGYPFNVPEYKNIYDKYQLFVYGFPYNRDWTEIRKYFLDLDSRVEGVYTNDNDDIAMYYLKEFNYTRPGTNFYPQYYIDIKDNLEFLDYKPLNSGEISKIDDVSFKLLYENVKEIGDFVTIYKLK